MLILLPPSEGKADGGDGAWSPTSGRHTALAETRVRVVKVLQGTEPKPLGLTGERRSDALAANASLLGSATLPAFQRYTGVVFEHLDPATLSPAAAARACDAVHVVSGLGGLFAWDDPVPQYRLKMGARLGDLGLMARLWAPLLGARVAALGGPVIDLLPVEHAAAVPPPAGVPWLRVELVGPDGQRSGHHGKAAKGLLARHLLTCADPVDAVRSGWVSPEGYTAVVVDR